VISVSFCSTVLGHTTFTLSIFVRCSKPKCNLFVTSGYATLLLAVIYYLRDLKQIKFGSIFKYSGMNAITIYFTTVGYQSNLHSYIYETVFVHSFYPAKLASLMYAVVVVLFYLGLGYVLYKNKIIIKV
jgi:predicted acyltransferase